MPVTLLKKFNYATFTLQKPGYATLCSLKNSPTSCRNNCEHNGYKPRSSPGNCLGLKPFDDPRQSQKNATSAISSTTQDEAWRTAAITMLPAQHSSSDKHLYPRRSSPGFFLWSMPFYTRHHPFPFDTFSPRKSPRTAPQRNEVCDSRANHGSRATVGGCTYWNASPNLSHWRGAPIYLHPMRTAY